MVKAKKVDCAQCTICQNKLKIGDEIVRLRCKHHFHKSCVVPWFKNNNTCPNCRAAATDLGADGDDEDWESV
jgi:Ring finger domain